MTRLSVNINKIATLRNARGGRLPDPVEAALAIENFGAQGITVHPRPDARHIRYDDVYALKNKIRTELNIEGYPSEDFINMVLETEPRQVTLVPDPPDVLTSNAGWDCINQLNFLKAVILKIKTKDIRVSLFLNPDPGQVAAVGDCGADRIELYTESYAVGFTQDPKKAVEPYMNTAKQALNRGLGINAGHDLNLENLSYFIEMIPEVDEVSIGHALISDALYYGLNNTVQMYLAKLKKN